MKVKIGSRYRENLARVNKLVEKAIGDFPSASRHLLNENGIEIRVEVIEKDTGDKGRCYECGSGTYPGDWRVCLSENNRRETYFLHKYHSKLA